MKNFDFINSVFEQFCNELEKRTNILTEDNVRYYWFSEMLKHDNDLNNYTLEHPYKGLLCNSSELQDPHRKELDLLYQNRNVAICFEMKFHRKNTKSDFAHTDAAGSIFNDLQRLKGLKENENKDFQCLFLYVTDDEMDSYFQNTSHQNNEYRIELNRFYNSSQKGNESYSFNKSDVPKTFWEQAFRSFNSQQESIQINLKLLKEKDLTIQNYPISEEKNESEGLTKAAVKFYIRLYEVLKDIHSHS